MTVLARASVALATVALTAVLAPAGAPAAKKPQHSTSVRLVAKLPTITPGDVSRKCGSSRSSGRIRWRRTTRPTKKRIRIVTRYCSGRKRTVILIRRPRRKVITQQVTVPAPKDPAPAPAPRQPFRLTLLHNNDGESKYVVGDSIAGYGGVARFKTVLDALRADAAATDVPGTSRGTVTISSGDNFLAGLNLRASFQRFDAGLGPFYDSDAIAQLGYDAVTIGNHEYDFGPARLAQFIAFERSGVPFLSANTDFSGEPLLQALRDKGRIADSAVVEKGGEQIGIIGVTTPDAPSISSTRNVTFDAAVAGIVNAEAARLNSAGVNKIILSSHLQNVEFEKALVGELRDVDIVISGGGDELLANAGDRLLPNSTPMGPYPTVATDLDARAVPIVTTQGEYRYVGRLTVTFDPSGHITSTDTAKSGPVRVTADPAQADYVAEDATLKTTITDPLVAYKAALAANVIGTTAVLLDGGNPNPIRVRESNLGDLVADAFLAGANHTAVADGRPVADVALSNGGGIRTSIAAGNITEKSTFDVLPFDNVLVTVPGVSPARLKELMEWGVAALPSPSGRFPQVSGFSMTVDTTQQAQVQTGAAVTTPGQRIRSLTLDDGTKIVENGAIVGGAPSVDLATTNFTANNGDNYPFTGLASVAAGVAYQQALYDYIVDDLGGAVTAGDYPVGGGGRIAITP